MIFFWENLDKSFQKQRFRNNVLETQVFNPKNTEKYFYNNENLLSYNNDRGYLYNSKNQATKYNNRKNIFAVGAPFYFYFGIKKGASALDVFKTKYLNE